MTLDHDTLQAPWLAEHEAFLRRLALGLVRDAHNADDLIQRTYLYALQSPPRRTATPRTWLRKVMRHLAINHSKSEQRRRDRESVVAREDVHVPVATLEEGREVAERLALAVRRLREPYRTTIELRYLEEVAPRDIASRTAVPVETVKTRLKRGRAQLREALDRDGQRDVRPWAVPLFAFLDTRRAQPAAGAEAATAPADSRATGPRSALGGRLLRLGAALAVVVSGLFFLRPGEGRDAPRQRVVRAAALTTDAAPARADLPPAAPRGDTAERSAASVGEPPSDPGFAVACRVVDAEGLPIAGARVVFEPAPESGVAEPAMPALPDLEARPEDERGRPLPFAISDEQGFARLEGVRGWGSVSVRGADWLTFLPAYVHGYAPAGGVVLVAGPPRRFFGRVVEPGGTPLPGVEVGLIRRPDFVRTAPEDDLYAYENYPGESHTDAGGRFELVAPLLAHTALRFRREGYATACRLLTDCEGTLLEVVLPPRAGTTTRGAAEGKVARAGFETHWMRGRVTDLAGRPLAGARVSAGSADMLSDEDGRFELRIDALRRITRALARREGDEGIRVTATLPGFLPDRRLVERRWGEKRDAQEEILLELGRPAPGLEGRVVDPEGRPLAGVEVWPADLTCLSASGVRGLAVEDALAGRDPLTITTNRTSYLGHAITDAAGRFRIDALEDRPYRLRARDPRTGARLRAGPFVPGNAGPAGSGAVELVLDRGDLWTRVAGAIRTGEGASVRRAVVWLVADEQELAHAGQRVGRRPVVLDRTTPDAEGAFAFEDVPRRDTYLIVTGDEVFHTTYGRGEAKPLGDTEAELVEGLEIRVPRRLRAQLTLVDPTEADAVRAFSAGGEAGEPLLITRGKPRIPFLFLEDSAAEIGKGAATLWLPEMPLTLVLYRGGEEVRRTSLMPAGPGPLELAL